MAFSRLSHHTSRGTLVLCFYKSDIEHSTPIGSRCFIVEFLQSAAASSLAPCSLMWQSCKPNTVSVHFDWSLSIDAKLSTFAMLK